MKTLQFGRCEWRLQVKPGSQIHAVVDELIELATTARITCIARFNGTEVMADPDDDFERVMERYDTALKESRQSAGCQ